MKLKKLSCILLIFLIFGCKDKYEKANEECLRLAQYYINLEEGQENTRRQEYLKHREQLITMFFHDSLSKKEVLYFVDRYQILWFKKKLLDYEISLLMEEHRRMIDGKGH